MNRTRTHGARGPLTLVGSAIAVALALAACGSSSNSSSTASSGLSKSTGASSAPLIVNFALAAATLDPDFTEANQEVGIDGNMYSTLTQPVHVAGPIAGTTEV